MYLSRIILNARSRDARRWLADCHVLHHVIMSGLPSLDGKDPRAQLGVLYRVEHMEEPPLIPVLVQSRQEPRWQIESDAIVSVDPPRPLDALLAGVAQGRRYRFRLRANPTRRVHKRALVGPDPETGRAAAEKPGSEGKRVELRGEDDQLQWLVDRGKAVGFAPITTRLTPSDRDIPAVSVKPGGVLKGRNSRGQPLTFATALFEGIIEVTDADHFRAAVATGIGPGKAYGLGLLSVAPAAR